MKTVSSYARVQSAALAGEKWSLHAHFIENIDACNVKVSSQDNNYHIEMKTVSITQTSLIVTGVDLA